MHKFSLFYCLFFALAGCQLTPAPVIISVAHDGGTNGCGFNFRSDGTYEWWNGAFMYMESADGTYTMTDSLITLDRSTIGRSIVTPYLKLSTQAALWDSTKTATYLFQVDKNGEIIKDATPFIDYSYEQRYNMGSAAQQE